MARKKNDRDSYAVEVCPDGHTAYHEHDGGLRCPTGRVQRDDGTWTEGAPSTLDPPRNPNAF